MISDIWVVNYRLELEANSNQTEDVFPAVFTSEREARAYARFALDFIAKRWGTPVEERDIVEMSAEFSKRGGRGFVKSYLFQLTDSDNLVIEITKCKVHDNKEAWK